jgi:hypothetical protein
VIRRLAFAALLAAVSGCSGDSSPSSPTSPGGTVPGRVTINLSVTNTITGGGVGAVTTEVSGLPTLLEVGEPGFVTRSAWITSARPTVDLIPDAPPFSLDFYRQFVRGSIDHEQALQPLRRWTRPPRIYLKTADEAGTPISAAQLDSTEQTLLEAAESFTGGRFGLGGVERGTGTREGQAGWITVKWLAPSSEAICGRATIAQDGGYIEFNYLRGGSCSCGPLGTRPRTVRHELGHAFGYWHTDSTADLMSGAGIAGCQGALSDRERYHAAIAYARPVGSRDVDVDPSATVSTLTTRDLPPVVIDD